MNAFIKQSVDEGKGKAMDMQTPPAPGTTLMTDGRGPFAEGKKGWIFWEVFVRTAGLGLQFGAIFGALLGVGFYIYGALVGVVIGGVLGLAIGLPLGLVLAGITRAWFYPLTNTVLYRRVIGAIGVVVSYVSAVIAFGGFTGGVWPENRLEAYLNPVVLALSLLAAVAAWLASRRLGDWYIGAMGEAGRHTPAGGGENGDDGTP